MNTETVSNGPTSNSVLVTVNDQPHRLGDHSPIGRQILSAAGLSPATDYALLQLRNDGTIEEIGPDENASLGDAEGGSRFYAWKTDRLFYFTLDERKFPWADEISEEKLRDICRVPVDKSIWVDRQGVPDQELAPGSRLELKGNGIERLYTKARLWKLDVQGTIIESESQHIQVQAALTKAGVDVSKPWIIVLLVSGEPKRTVSLNTIIDLATPGIERIRLMPDKINNGDGQSMRRNFELLPKDVVYLNRQHPGWETIEENQTRWLILPQYRLPPGYTAETTIVAMRVPGPYPAAEIDMFYCYPPLSLTSGAPIPQLSGGVDIGGRQFQQWSRHRDAGVWSPTHDCILTHMGLVEESLNREVGL
jgi:hypothetical protein